MYQNRSLSRQANCAEQQQFCRYGSKDEWKNDAKRLLDPTKQSASRRYAKRHHFTHFEVPVNLEEGWGLSDIISSDQSST